MIDHRLQAWIAAQDCTFGYLPPGTAWHWLGQPGHDKGPLGPLGHYVGSGRQWQAHACLNGWQAYAYRGPTLKRSSNVTAVRSTAVRAVQQDAMTWWWCMWVREPTFACASACAWYSAMLGGAHVTSSRNMAATYDQQRQHIHSVASPSLVTCTRSLSEGSRITLRR